MPHRKFFFLLILISVLALLLPANTFSIDKNLPVTKEQIVITQQSSESDELSSRSQVNSRTNYQLPYRDPVSMPEVNKSWNQSDWRGGPGQNVWEKVDEFGNSENINYSTSDGRVELSSGVEIQAWKQLNDGPEPRFQHNMVWSPSKEVFYVFGGRKGSQSSTYVIDELYEFNPAAGTWTKKSQFGGPSARCYSLAVWDSQNDLLWIFGGRGQNWNDRYGDLWCYDPDTDAWTLKPACPRKLSSAAGAYDPVHNQIIVYGGYNDTTSGPPYSYEVFTFNISSEKWSQKRNYTKRFYHDAVWCPKTNSMFVYGGAEGYSGSNYIYVNEMNEYFPVNDTWKNHSTVGPRIRPMLAWDTLNEKIILYGGYHSGRKNETWYYDIEAKSWERKEDGPEAMDSADGDWDTVSNQFVTYAGEIYWRPKDYTWSYLPNTTGYEKYGELISSVYSPGYKMNFRNLMFNISKPVGRNVGSQPVKIQIAASGTSADDADQFMGPNGLNDTCYYDEKGQLIPKKLDGAKFICYKLNLSTGNQLISPKLNWVRIDYYIYPESYTYESPIEMLPEPGPALREVNWTCSEPNGTCIDIYFRQSDSTSTLQSKAWEKVIPGQTVFEQKGGNFFQYKAEFSTTEPGDTGVLERINFIFNQQPSEPALVSPADDSWVGDSKPTLKWEFSDPDENDYQTGFEINFAIDQTFTEIKYSSGGIEKENKSYRINEDLEDGTYYWRVKVMDNYKSWSGWSSSYKIKIDTQKPPAPSLECFSHPLEHIWYSNNKAVFDWNEPKDACGISGYSYIIDNSPVTEPEETIIMTDEEFRMKHNLTEYEGLVIEDSIPDGIWYFHLRSVDSLGFWSETAHRVIRVDITPPSIIDYTPDEVIVGTSINFRFELNDSGSGMDITTIYWKYSSELDFEDYEMDKGAGDNYSFNHVLKKTTDTYLEYYIEARDFADEVNTVRYPAKNLKRIDLIDEEPPSIVEITGNKTQNRYSDLEIVVKGKDNVGLSHAKVFFNDQYSGKTMTKKDDETFTYKIERMELSNLAGYSAEDVILYRIILWDYQNNSVKSPETGNYNITLVGLGDEEPPKKDEPEEKGFSEALLLNLLVLIILIVIIAIFLFYFVRKQSEKIGEERHKLRMAIADVQEGAETAPPALVAPSTGLQSIEGSQPPQQLPAIESAPQPEVPQPHTLEGQLTPVGYLPEPAVQKPEPSPQPKEDQSYKEAGLMVAEEKETGLEHEETEPNQISQQDDVSTNDTQNEPLIIIDDELSVSLPEGGESESGVEEPADSPEKKKTDLKNNSESN